MSVTININQFDGGHAEDVRTFASNQSESSVNFDIHTNPHKLMPYSDPIAETSLDGPMTDDSITDVAAVNVSGTVTIYGMGRTSSGNQDVAIFKKNSTTDITAAWTEVATSTNDLTPGTLIEYKDKLYFIAGGSTFSSFTAPSTITGIATVAGPYTTNFSPKPFRHPIDDTLYLASGNLVYKFDNVTYTTPTLTHTLGTNQEIQCFSEYGNYLAIGVRYLYNNKNSYVYLSNRVIPNDGPQSVIDWGEGQLSVLENIGGALIGISYTKIVGNFSSSINRYKMFIKGFAGGTVQTIKEFATGRTDAIKVWKSKNNDKLYFGFDTDNAIYVLGKNKNGEWFVAKDRYYNPSGSYITGTFNGISTINDIYFTSYQDGGVTGYLARQGTETTYALPSIYTTTINPNMPATDRIIRKRLISVKLSYTVNDSNGVATVKVSTDGGTYTTAISKTQSSTGEYATVEQEFTNNDAFDEGYEYQFILQTTGNVSIKQFQYSYEKINE